MKKISAHEKTLKYKNIPCLPSTKTPEGVELVPLSLLFFMLHCFALPIQLGSIVLALPELLSEAGVVRPSLMLPGLVGGEVLYITGLTMLSSPSQPAKMSLSLSDSSVFLNHERVPILMMFPPTARWAALLPQASSLTLVVYQWTWW